MFTIVKVQDKVNDDMKNSKIENDTSNKEWTYIHITTINTELDVDLSSIEYIGVGGIVDSSAVTEVNNVTILPASVFLALNRKLQCFSYTGTQLMLANVIKVSDTKVNVSFDRYTSAVLIYK